MKTSRSRFLVLLLIWGLAAAAAGALHVLVHLPPRTVPLLVAGMSIGLTFAVARVGWIGEAVRSFGVRGILGFHVMRFAGAYFLLLEAQGRLPAEFARRAGWGDIAAAGGALVLVLGPATWRRGWTLAAWNIFGLIDLLVAVGTAGWLNVTRPGSMIEIASLPLTLVPLFFVPLLMSSHFTFLRHLLRGKSSAVFPVGRPAFPT